MLDPEEEIANALFAPHREDWVEAPPTWRVTTPGRRVPDLVVDYVRAQQEEGVRRRVRFALHLDGATFRVMLTPGGRICISFHWHSKGGVRTQVESPQFRYSL